MNKLSYLSLCIYLARRERNAFPTPENETKVKQAFEAWNRARKGT